MLIITGQTATGKTALSIELAKKLDGEIVSADSRQVYSGMDIGTAKVTVDEMQGIPHHMIDIVDPREQVYTAGDYVRDARVVIQDIHARGKLPIIVGGSGMYIDMLVGRLALDTIEPNPQLRAELEGMGLQELQNRLQGLDPELFDSIDIHNKVRVVRAIEKTKSSKDVGPIDPLPPLPADLSPSWLGLTLPPQQLREKIHQRNIERLENGLVEEVTALHESGLSWERMDQMGLEYRYVPQFIRGEISRERLVELLDTKTWQFAKRQMTWLKRNPDIRWMNPPVDSDALVKEILRETKL